MKLEDILKKQGFSDADLAAAGPLLGDARFRGAVEKHVSQTESELSAFQAENDRWADWHEKTNKPQIEALAREKVELASRAGSLDARVRALDPTYKPEGAPTERQPAAGGGAPADFDATKYMTRTAFEEEVKKYASGQGMAIAMANDLAMEYKRLTGADMLDYQTTDSDGRPMTGMSALLMEARRDSKPLPDYIATKFDFAGKRATAKAASDKAAEDAIRKDERMKVVSEYGNPNTRPGMPSHSPVFTSRPEAGGKMPWEIPATERKNARIQRALETQARSTVN